MERQVPVLAANRPKFIREALVSQPFEFILKEIVPNARTRVSINQ